MGSDLQWGMCAGKVGHSVFHFSFSGHRTGAPSSEVVILNEEQLLKADSYLAEANKRLNRKWPVKNDWTANLLRRNYYQVNNSDSVYAVSTIDYEKQIVNGGTGWACAMFLDIHGDDGYRPLYVYDQNTNKWMGWDNRFVEVTPPFPSGIWAGIGSRDLSQEGKNAIRVLMGYNPP